jgi:hypothetical protein
VQKLRPYLQNNPRKMAGSLAEAVQCLPCKSKDLSSNPVIGKKKKKKKEKEKRKKEKEVRD